MTKKVGNFEFNSTDIEGVFVIQPKCYGDNRGYSFKNKGNSMFKNFNSKDRGCQKYNGDWRDINFCKCSK